jgi:hypothetical protein
MPALFSLGQRAALHTVQEELQDGESLFAFLDDIYVLVPPNRVRPVYDLLSHHLFTSAHIRLNAGKARVWNANGVPPPGIAPLGPNVWVGNQALPAEEQGLMILGTPVGSSQYQQHQLAHLRTQHDQLLQRIPELEDLQAFALNHPERMRAANEIPTGERLQPSQTMDHQAYEQACEQLQKVDSRIPPDVIKKAIQLFFSTHLLPDYDLTQAQVRELPATNMLALILPLPDTSHFQMPPPFHKRQNHTWALLHGTTLHTSQLISLKVRSDQPTGLIIKTFNAVTCQPSGPSTLAEK